RTTLHCLLALLLTGQATGVIPALNSTQVTAAKTEAEAMNIRESGYVLGSYLLKAYNQDVFLAANSPEVDGIVLSTPYEQVRYEAYLAHLENHPRTTLHCLLALLLTGQATGVIPALNSTQVTAAKT
ncbi:hypothetical protein CTI14_49360, partial [Methylobacterium radiotolerans]